MSGPAQAKKTAVFEVIGPVEIPFQKRTQGAKWIGRDDASAFWDQPLGARVEDRIGCYVFAIAGGSGTPWYVGKTTRSFRKECFQDHKLLRYNEALSLSPKGKPVLFFLAYRARPGKPPRTAFKELEDFLIDAARAQNSELTNYGRDEGQPAWEIAGVISTSPGKPSKAARSFRRMIGL
jgi:hypothetical protein